MTPPFFIHEVANFVTVHGYFDSIGETHPTLKYPTFNSFYNAFQVAL